VDVRAVEPLAGIPDDPESGAVGEPASLRFKLQTALGETTLMLDDRTPSASPASERNVIEVRLRDVRQLFDAMDPSRFEKRISTPRRKSSLSTATRSFLRAPHEIVIHLDQATGLSDEDRAIGVDLDEREVASAVVMVGAACFPAYRRLQEYPKPVEETDVSVSCIRFRNRLGCTADRRQAVSLDVGLVFM
jgi:hypothetical protein